MPGGRAWRICPLGPFTSTTLPSTLMVTPLGIAIGFFPIRDIVVTYQRAVRGSTDASRSPHVTENLSAHSGPLRRTAAHHAARGRQDADAESSQDRRHGVAAEDRKSTR